MVNLFRRYQQPLMIGFTILTIVTFAGLYSHTDFLDRSHAGQVAEIYGHSVTLAQLQRMGRKADLSQELGMSEFFRSLASEPGRDPRQNFIWNSMVLRHEAEKLGVEPTEDEVFQAIKDMQIFQENGVYQSTKYAIITQVLLNPRGFSPDDLSDVVADGLRLRKIENLLGATVTPSEAEVRDAYTEYNQKTEASVVRFKLADFLSTTQVPEEEVKKYYEERKATLKTEELRKVRFVAFTLPSPAHPADKPLAGKVRAEALMKLQKEAEDFAVAMAEKNANFNEAAAKAGVKVQESPDFSATGAPEGLGASREAVAAAFKLTKQDPNSDVIESSKGYYVLQLVGITPARPLTYEEARPKLAETLKQERAEEALSLKASETRNKIEASMKAGKNFADAAKAAGVEAVDFPPFSMKESKGDSPDAAEIVQATSGLKAGQVSTPVATADHGFVLVYVVRRLPVDEAQFEAEKGQYADMLRGYQRVELFMEWLKLRRAAAQLKQTTLAS